MATDRRMDLGGEEQWLHRGRDSGIPPMAEPLGAHLLRRLAHCKNSRIQIDPASGHTESAQQVLSRSISVAMELRGRGLGPGDVVALALDNCLEAMPLVLGCLFAGAIFAPLNPAFDEADFRTLLRALNPRLLLYSPRAAAALRLALPPGLPAVQLRPDCADWAAFVRPRGAAAEADFRADGSAGPEDTAAVMCSSGTTGPPKGVQVTQGSLYFVLELAYQARLNPNRSMDYGDAAVVALVLPVFWVSAMVNTLISVNNDSALLVFRAFEVDALLAGVEKYKVTSTMLSPQQAAAIAKQAGIERYDVSSLRSIAYTGAALSQPLKLQLEQRLKKPVLGLYAQTESLSIVYPGPLNPRKPGTMGTAAPDTAIKVVDLETGRTVGPNTQGELYVKGPTVTTGYYNNPEATAAAFDSDGWLKTGDVVSFDEDGYFYVHDRCKELIKYKGVHVFPAEMENVLLTHEGVRDAAVAGVHDDDDQEHAVGLVVPQPGVELTEEELHELVRSKLSEYKWLHGGIYFVDEIPRTGTDKVKRRDLRIMVRNIRGK